MWVDRQPGGFAVITLAKEPANVMDLAFWEGLTALLDELEGDSSMHGVIFASGLKRDIFTAGAAGLELMHALRPSQVQTATLSRCILRDVLSWPGACACACACARLPSCHACKTHSRG